MARCCECRSPVSSSVFSVMEIARAFNHRASERRSSFTYALDFVGTRDSFVEFRLDRLVGGAACACPTYKNHVDLSIVYLLSPAEEKDAIVPVTVASPIMQQTLWPQLTKLDRIAAWQTDLPIRVRFPRIEYVTRERYNAPCSIVFRRF